MDTFDPTRCQHPRQEVRRKAVAGGQFQFRSQCLDCGRAIGGAVGRAKVPEPWIDFDLALLERHWGEEARHERASSRDQAPWFEETHREYLTSPAWRAIADRVLSRERGVCQGCGGRATQVHHLTYAHLGHEFLFELVAICRTCHDRLHP